MSQVKTKDVSNNESRSRRQNTINRIRGPQSALTDFLASQNISAHQIRRDHERRRQAALEHLAQDDLQSERRTESQEEDKEENAETITQIKKRKRQNDKAMAKIKRSVGFKRQKSRLSGDLEGDEEQFALDMYAKSQPIPGQLENCEVCGKRFTFTSYSKTGPDGGLLCTKCSKEQEAERKKDAKSLKQPRNKLKQRQKQSMLLDGIIQTGAKTLQQLCIEKVADSINNVEDFGDLPPTLFNTLSEILSRERALTSRTMEFFLRPELDKINLYDCAKFETSDFIKILAMVPRVETLILGHAGQIKDKFLDYIIERDIPIKYLDLEAANLVSDSKWREFFVKQGERLTTLKLSWLDYSMDDDTLGQMVASCPNLMELELKRCFKLSDASLEALGRFKNLEHLSLLFKLPTSSGTLKNLIEKVGSNLRTLSLEMFDHSDDPVLLAIHSSCKNLSKLVFTNNSNCTDAAFVSLFDDWVNPPLTFVDLSSNRDLDCTNPDGPLEPIGLASKGFKALMRHSGKCLENLDIHSCRHISYQALAEIFDGINQYPALRDIDVSFVQKVDTTIAAGIFKSCPAIKKFVAFGCFGLTDVLVPPGVAFIGICAQDLIVQGQLRDELRAEMRDFALRCG